MARVLVKDVTTQLSTDIGIVTIPGEVKAYAGATAPTGFLFCHGQAVSRTTYSALYAVLGNSHGSGDGLTTFNLPDYRGSFLRGLVNVTTVTGTGTVSGGTATFTSHNFNRTGFKVRMTSGVLSPLATGVDYYVSVVNNNTLRFATTKANALAGTFIAITGPNSAVLTQWEDPDYGSRERLTSGANATGLGGFQEDAVRNVTGTFAFTDDNATNFRHRVGQATGAFSGYYTTTSALSGTGGGVAVGVATDVDFDISRQVPVGNDARPKNVLINYIIKY